MGKEENSDKKIEEEEKNDDNKNKKIKTFKINNVILIVARKLCVNCMEEIEEKHQPQIPKFAELKCRDIFETILNGNKIFKTDPISQKGAAQQILKEVYGIDIDELII